MILIIDCEKNVTEKDVKDFEERYNVNLPIDLKKLLFKFNGGYTEDSDDVDKFLSLKYGAITIEMMIETHQVTEQNLPKQYLPFALDWSGNPITVCLNEGRDYGKIVKFYFDTDDEPETIADSLEELLGVKSMDDL
ncbi:MAG TPA: SMI1/KNR4 family protein [Flavobacterium sp.]|nr:SMI1/KNR4 family protein [Flavobacterium sp.]